eukprot:6745483-Karenia_brevis.AAC.1
MDGKISGSMASSASAVKPYAVDLPSAKKVRWRWMCADMVESSPCNNPAMWVRNARLCSAM